MTTCFAARPPSCSSRRFALLAVMAHLLLAGVAAAEDFPLAPAATTRIVDLREGAVGEATFDSIGGDALDLLIHPGSSLDLTLELPDGRVLTEANADALNATFIATELPPNALFLPEGQVQLVHLESPPSGTFRLRIDASGVASPPQAVVLDVYTTGATSSSLLRTGIGAVGERSDVEIGDEMSLILLVFEGDRPVTGSEAVATLRDSGGQTIATLPLHDDGVEGDAERGDGLYTARYVPDRLGAHVVTVDLSGTTSDGIAFSRREITEFTVFSANHHLTGAFLDRGRDLDGDGLYDAIEITMEARGPVLPGRYELQLVLEGESDSRIRSVAYLDLVAGDALTVTFDAERLERLGSDGPYALAKAVLTYGERLLDFLDDLGPTSAYRLDDLERPDLLLSPLIREEGVDTDGDGRFDRLDVVVGVDALVPGAYTVTSILGEPGGGGIDSAAATVDLARGANEVTLRFSGAAIGASTADGPYHLVNLAAYPEHGAAVRTAFREDMGETRPYRCLEFEACEEVGDLDALVALVEGLPLEPGIRTSLLRKATNARSAFDRGNAGATLGLLGALRAETEAQRGRGVGEDDADRLLDAIDALVLALE